MPALLTRALSKKAARAHKGAATSAFDDWLAANPHPSLKLAREDEPPPAQEGTQPEGGRSGAIQTVGVEARHVAGGSPALEATPPPGSPAECSPGHSWPQAIHDDGARPRGLCASWQSLSEPKLGPGYLEGLAAPPDQQDQRRPDDLCGDAELGLLLPPGGAPGQAAAAGEGWRRFPWRATGDLVYSCLQARDLEWDARGQRLVEVTGASAQRRLEVVPPLIQLPAAGADVTPLGYASPLSRTPGGSQLLALLCADSAALGVFADGALVKHKVITAYTVRAQQGKAQLQHLRQGGSSGRMSAGGGIRARETVRLFCRINEKLQEWEQELGHCGVLAYSGTLRVWNEVYACRSPTMPIPRADPRWRRVPHTVRRPRLRELQRIYYEISHGSVGYATVPYTP